MSRFLLSPFTFVLNHYNKIAYTYDILSWMVYGKRLINIQKDLIKKLPKAGKILILGGGNGKILPIIFNHAPSLNIEYVEASSLMIKLAKKYKHPRQSVTFHHADALTFKLKSEHIYAGFFLDLLDEKQIELLIRKHQFKNKTSYWYIADFQLNKETELYLLRRIQLFFTILFFKITTRHSINNLPKIEAIFENIGYKTNQYSDKKSFICWKIISSINN